MVADGAGSASRGGQGAQVAVETFASLVAARVEQSGTCDRNDLEQAFDATVLAVHECARAENVPVSELSSTLVGAASLESETLFFQIGDGASVYRLGDSYHVAIWAAASEFVNTTVFVTAPEAKSHFQIRRVAGRIDELAILSDGLQYIVLDHRSQLPHDKFFSSVSEAFGQDEPGLSEFYSRWIEALLGSDHIQSRTDDDTALVVAKRWEI
jgi:hypothetical protein